LGSAVPLVASLAAVAAAAVVDVVAAIVSALALADVGAVLPAPAVVEAAAAAVGGDTVGDICAEEEGDEWLLSTTEMGDKTGRGEGVRRARAAATSVAAASKAGDGGRPELDGDSSARLSLCTLDAVLC